MKKIEKLLLNFYESARLFFAIIWVNSLGEVLTLHYQIHLFKKIQDQDEKEERKKEIIRDFFKAFFFVSLVAFILFWIIFLIIPMYIFAILAICSFLIFLGTKAIEFLDEFTN